MAWRQLPARDDRYALVCYDKDGAERTDDPDAHGGLFGDRVVADLAEHPKSDVFLFSHGWKGDMNAAVEQYDRWIGALVDRTGDRAKAEAKRPGFAPLFVGLHWPSLPFGDEEIDAGASFAASASASGVNPVDVYVERLGEHPDIRTALAVIFEQAKRNAAADQLNDAAREAYKQLDKTLALGANGPGGDPASDRAPFDPDESVKNAAEASVDFGDTGAGGLLLAPLRQLSFWTMKKRARSIGEAGMHDFVKRLQEAAPEARFHLMGHSFGCIVMSSVLSGRAGTAALPRPVDSCVLVQGAMSLWSCAPDIPKAPGTPGYFHRLIGEGRVKGPILVTSSRFDRAVGTFYPLAAGAAGQVDFLGGDNFPKYGGTGAFGLRGVQNAEDMKMLGADDDYQLTPARIHNLESSRYICKGDGASGAHSDIAGPEVAHAIWQAAIA